ncbi:MAG: hypothetical protein ACI4AL_06885 [Aristaeellaceae bacterium]
MIRRKDFLESIGTPDKGFNAAMDRALLQISREERRTHVKRKMRLSLIAAIIAAIVLSGVAFAIGMNLFEYFGKYDERLAKLAPQSALETVKPEKVESEALGTTKAAFNSAYYDGENLIAAFNLENSERYESYEPTTEMLARMEKVDPQYFSVPYDENAPGIEAYNAYQTAIQEGKPAGIACYSIYPSDHCTTGDGIDLPPWTEQMDTLPDGSKLFLREFENPLPEEAQNQNSLDLHIKLWQMPSYYYFDGINHYELYDTQQDVGEITTVVKRTDAIFKAFAGTGEFNGVSLTAELQISAARATLDISAVDTVFEFPGDHCWYDALLITENGGALRTEEVAFSDKGATVSFRGNGTLPEQLTLYVGIDKEGEWNQADFIASAAKIDLIPIDK